jgi:hypothetical protein
MAALSFWDLDVNKSLNFILTSGDSILNLSGATVTMQLNDGSNYGMTVVSAASGTVQYIVGKKDFCESRNYVGQMRVSFGESRFYSSTFEMIVRQSVQRS